MCTAINPADRGVRVIKVERPGGGDFARAYDERVRGLASHFVWANRSEEILTLDVKHAEAGVILDKLLQDADVLVQNLAPGAASRFGLSYGALRDTCPRLSMCDISGYGADGPCQDRKAHDLPIRSEAGFLSRQDEPAKAGCSIAALREQKTIQQAAEKPLRRPIFGLRCSAYNAYVCAPMPCHA